MNQRKSHLERCGIGKGSRFLSPSTCCQPPPACLLLLGQRGGWALGYTMVCVGGMDGGGQRIPESWQSWPLESSVFLPGSPGGRATGNFPPPTVPRAFLEPSVQPAKKGSAHSPLELQIFSLCSGRTVLPLPWGTPSITTVTNKNMILAMGTLFVFYVMFSYLIPFSSLNKSDKYSVGFTDEETGAKTLSNLQGVTPAGK